MTTEAVKYRRHSSVSLSQPLDFMPTCTKVSCSIKLTTLHIHGHVAESLLTKYFALESLHDANSNEVNLF
jgi:hypothetical protein